MLSQKEFASKIGISRKTLYNYIRSGVIVPRIHPITNRYFFTEEDVASYEKGEEIKHDPALLSSDK